jgi:serine/threonine-protein kinase
MSVVYLAEDPRLARRVAIKVLAPELAEDESFRNRFVRESQLAAGLDHPNIVPVYEAGEVDGHLFIAMRYVQGTDLRALILREGTLDPERTTSLIRPVAGALDAAHRRGLVHRDVKPANILVAFDEGEEHPYLSDFGLTKHTSSKSGLTKTGTFMGTVDYVAPEQIQGGEVDGRTDEYSLACVVYQCLTGAVPFDKGTDVATLFAHLQDPLPKVSGRRPSVPAELDEVVARGMAKEREDRYPTCTAMMDLIAGAIGLPVRREAPSIDPTVVAAPPQPGLGPLLPAAPEPSVPSISSTPPVRATGLPLGSRGAFATEMAGSRCVAAALAPPIAIEPHGSLDVAARLAATRPVTGTPLVARNVAAPIQAVSGVDGGVALLHRSATASPGGQPRLACQAQSAP